MLKSLITTADVNERAAYGHTKERRLRVASFCASGNNKEFLLKVFFEPCEPTESKAVFMTASEIHAKLKMFGNIDKPMPLNKFGELLKRSGYKEKVVHGGKHGYVVKMTENLSVRRNEDIHELLTGGSGGSTF